MSLQNAAPITVTTKKKKVVTLAIPRKSAVAAAPQPSSQRAVEVQSAGVVAAAPLPAKPAPRQMPVISEETRTRIAMAPKKRSIALLSDRSDALQRVETAEANKRAAPTREPPAAASWCASVLANGTTPAERAMVYAQAANTVMRQSQRNIVVHFVVLAKLLQQATVGAVLAETALDLARSGQY